MELASEAAARGIGFSAIYTAGDSLITRARNRLVNRFLGRPGLSHLLFIDADIGFSPDQAFRLLASGHSVVGGVYPLKNIFWDRIASGALTPSARQARSLDTSLARAPRRAKMGVGSLPSITSVPAFC